MVAWTFQRHEAGSLAEVSLSHWLHGLRESVTAITGWAHMLVGMRDETKRVQAWDAIERNATRLRQLLYHPPS